MVVAWRLFELVVRDEIRVFFFEETADEVEEAADEVGDDDGEQDEAENGVDVLHDEREDDLLAAGLVAEQRLDQLVDAVHLEEREDALDPHQTHQFDYHSDI